MSDGEQVNSEQMKFAGCCAINESTVDCANEVANRVLEALGGEPKFAMVFMTHPHIEQCAEVSRTLRAKFGGAIVIGVSASGVIAGGAEIEKSPAISIFAGKFGDQITSGVRVKAFTDEELTVVDSEETAKSEWMPTMGIDKDTRCVILFADPTSVPMLTLLPWFNAATSECGVPVVGGMASGGTKPGSNVIMLNDRVRRHGLVGMSISGDIRVDTVLSQGCKGFGPTMVVTKSHRNMILELGGRRALDVVQETVELLNEEQREIAGRGLFVGLVVDENKPRFGRGDFVMRAVVGIERDSGAVAVADFPKVGQTVRLHMRDAATAREDLELLLDAQKLYDTPLGSLLIACNLRGEKFFEGRHRDAEIVQRAFGFRRGGETTGAGQILDPAAEAAVPQAGILASGEIGPLGSKSFVHGLTACALLFRELD